MPPRKGNFGHDHGVRCRTISHKKAYPHHPLANISDKTIRCISVTDKRADVYFFPNTEKGHIFLSLIMFFQETGRRKHPPPC